jgi:hypothetical protein
VSLVSCKTDNLEQTKKDRESEYLKKYSMGKTVSYFKDQLTPDMDYEKFFKDTKNTIIYDNSILTTKGSLCSIEFNSVKDTITSVIISLVVSKASLKYREKYVSLVSATIAEFIPKKDLSEVYITNYMKYSIDNNVKVTKIINDLKITFFYHYESKSLQYIITRSGLNLKG